ncbi:MAG: aspartate--ammonia ligase, partial [Tannerella sp.]
MNLYLPPDYRPMLPTEGMEDAIKLLKQTFQAELAEALSLRRVTAPLFVFADSGLNDNLNGVERPVSFPIKDMGDRRAEVVHSLAKWKRMKLAAYRIPPGHGLYTDMNAIRADEELDNIHSLYVDQWDWERTIRPEDRTVDFLHDIVRRIYGALLATEAVTHRAFPHIPPTLPREITFVHAEELRAEFPDLSPKEREREAARRYGAVFIRGIGGPLADGSRHDGRAPDYDDWSAPTPDGLHGLNGDILV